MLISQFRSGVTTEPRVLVTASRHGLLDELKGAYDILEDIQKGLHDYLEKKRLFFSRFFNVFIIINLVLFHMHYYYANNLHFHLFFQILFFV